ncbi:hypothetical protein RHGRI_029307 [Rhododendron griersonianum]|uniref:Uncharacterized protein n=1 Tax=Rhododendron griersonianum TaxID=479676 RepID=A0AAV6IJ92_9ERIC|nr:hypothetical protein RHGRI_029307 [Rhododendron griersonianum]
MTDKERAEIKEHLDPRARQRGQFEICDSSTWWWGEVRDKGDANRAFVVVPYLEDASSGYDKEFSRSYGGFVRRIQVDRLVSERGFQLQLKVKDGGRAWFALLPELRGNGGWVNISRKFWAFCGWKRADDLIDGRSCKDVANIAGWPGNTVVVEKEGRRCGACDVRVREESTQANMRVLGRCLVGRLEDGAMVLPTAMEVQRWA